jgi:hypothetical protein
MSYVWLSALLFYLRQWVLNATSVEPVPSAKRLICLYFEFEVLEFEADVTVVDDQSAGLWRVNAELRLALTTCLFYRNFESQQGQAKDDADAGNDGVSQSGFFLMTYKQRLIEFCPLCFQPVASNFNSLIVCRLLYLRKCRIRVPYSWGASGKQILVDFATLKLGEWDETKRQFL